MHHQNAAARNDSKNAAVRLLDLSPPGHWRGGAATINRLLIFRVSSQRGCRSTMSLDTKAFIDTLVEWIALPLLAESRQ